GEVYMVGTVAAFYIAGGLVRQQQPLWISLPLTFLGAMLVCSILGFLIESLAYRPLRSRPRLVVLITAIGVSLLLQNLAQTRYIFGPTPRPFPPMIEPKSVISFHVGDSPSPVSISNLDLLSFGL